MRWISLWVTCRLINCHFKCVRIFIIHPHHTSCIRTNMSYTCYHIRWALEQLIFNILYNINQLYVTAAAECIMYITSPCLNHTIYYMQRVQRIPFWSYYVYLKIHNYINTIKTLILSACMLFDEKSPEMRMTHGKMNICDSNEIKLFPSLN